MTTSKIAWDNYAQGFVPEVRSTENGYEASVSFRDISAQGSTAFEAIGGLMRLYCELSRTGEFNPHLPDNVGAPPVQHVLGVLQEMLARRVSEREAHRLLTYENEARSDDREGTMLSRPGNHRDDGSPTWGSSYTKHHVFVRDNEVISGLATAIAALARVKEL